LGDALTNFAVDDIAGYNSYSECISGSLTATLVAGSTVHLNANYNIGSAAYVSTAGAFSLSCKISSVTISYSYKLSGGSALPSPLFTEDGLELTVFSSSPLDVGTYNIEMKATASDGVNVVEQTVTFTITVTADSFLVEDTGGVVLQDITYTVMDPLATFTFSDFVSNGLISVT